MSKLRVLSGGADRAATEKSKVVITPSRDRLNKNLLKRMVYLKTHTLIRMLEDPSVTPEERDKFVRYHVRLTVGTLAILSIVVSVSMFIPSEPALPLPVPVIETAGVVKNIELHATTFTTETTVTTTTGIFQVRGGVSATIGETSTMKTEIRQPGGMAHKSLCIESKIKKSCYELL